MASIYVYELNSNSLNPLVIIENDKMQKDHCKEMGYELYYPIGYVIQFDPGSYLSGQTMLSYTTTNGYIFIAEGSIDNVDDAKAAFTLKTPSLPTLEVLSLSSFGSVLLGL